MKKTLLLGATLFLGASLCTFANDLLSDHGFLDGTGWTFYVSPVAAKAKATVIQDGRKITVASPPVEKQSAENIQILKSLQLEPDHKYLITLQILTDKPAKVVLLYWGDTTSQLYAGTEIDANPDQEEYQTKLNVKHAADGGYEDARSLRLLVGRFADANVTLANIRVEEE